MGADFRVGGAGLAALLVWNKLRLASVGVELGWEEGRLCNSSMCRVVAETSFLQ